MARFVSARAAYLLGEIGLPSSDDMITRPPPGANAKIVAIYDYWRRIAPGTDVLPGRRHLHPEDIPKLLPNVWLVDVVSTPQRFKVRLVGTALQHAGILVKPGEFVDDPIPPALKEKILSDFRFVMTSRQPLWYRGPAYLPHDKEVFELERIFLPLAADGMNVDMLLCLTVFYNSSGKEW
jgi:hypothetical protein